MIRNMSITRFETVMCKFVSRCKIARNCIPSINHVGCEIIQIPRKLITTDGKFLNDSLSNPTHSHLLPANFYELSGSTLQVLTGYIGRGHTCQNGEELSLVIRNIKTAMMSRLLDVPWIQSSQPDLIHKQLKLNRLLHIYTVPLLSNADFDRVLIDIQNRVADLRPSCQVSILSDLLWLGFPENHSTVSSLFSHLHDNCRSLNISDLSELSSCMDNVVRLYPQLTRNVIRRFVHLLDSEQLSSAHLSEDDMIDLSRFVVSCSPFWSKDLSIKTAKLIVDWLNRTDTITNRNTLPEILGIVNVLSKMKPSPDDIERDLWSRIRILNEPLIESLDDGQMATMSRNMYNRLTYWREIDESLDQRSLYLLYNSNPKVSAVFNLLQQITPYTLHMERRNVENIILRNIHKMDAWITSYFAELILKIRCKNTDILAAYDDKLIEYSHVLIHSYFLKKIMRLFRKRSRQHLKSKKYFTPFLMQNLEESRVYQTNDAAMITSFLLERFPRVLPQILYNKTMGVIANGSLDNVVKISYGLNGIGKPQTAELCRQVLNLEVETTRRFKLYLDQMTDLDLFTGFIRRVYGFYLLKDASFIDAVERTYLRLLPSLTHRNLIGVVMSFVNFRLYNAQILDSIADFIVENASAVTFMQLFQFVNLLAMYGHTPPNAPRLRDICREHYVGVPTDQKHLMWTRVKFIDYLASCNICSPESLQSIFNLDFIGSYDAFINSSPDEGIQPQLHLMELNRVAVLDYPELNIPWFHEQYCQTHHNKMLPEITEHHHTSRLHREVRVALRDLLGPDRVSQIYVAAPYGYYADFECLMNKDGEIVNYQKSADTTKQSLTRIAVEVMHAKRYCLNSKRPLGLFMMKKQHMEMLGYKYVEIPYFEWNSMPLSDWSEKLQYLHDKLYF